MSTSQLIHNAVAPYPMGDVEKYFDQLDQLIGTNSGKNQYISVSHDSYATSVPILGGMTTKFRITDSQMDVVDMSQGYIYLDVHFDINLQLEDKYDANELRAGHMYTSYHRNACYFFVGLKSGAQLIDNYSVYSNGRLTGCKQIKAVHEQTIVFNCKSREQKSCRPKMYSVHEDVLKMNDCVCGVYVQQPEQWRTNTITIPDNHLQVLIQVDDLLPFSGMSYFPRFACGELELEVSFTTENNFVFCQVPYETVLNSPYISLEETEYLGTKDTVKDLIFNNATKNVDNAIIYGVDALRPVEKALYRPANVNVISPLYLMAQQDTAFTFNNIDRQIDSRFHQCGEFARCCIGLSLYASHTRTAYPYSENRRLSSTTKLYMTAHVSNLSITTARSQVFGFNIKSDSKRNLLQMFQSDGSLTIPAQWIDHAVFGQLPGTEGMKMNATMPLYNCGMLIFTFPNSYNQLTVSRNPYLSAFRVHVGDRLIPDKEMATYGAEFAEMVLTGLGFDRLWASSNELRTSLFPFQNKLYNREYVSKEDDSDFMAVIDLERNGQGVIHDGFSDQYANITLDGYYKSANENPHYYELQGRFGTNTAATPAQKYPLRQIAPNIFAVQDAFWVFTPQGGDFVHDAASLELLRAKERRLQREHELVNN